MKFNFFTSFQF